MRRPAKAGLGSAYRAGFAWGLERQAPVLVEMDADLSHDPSALPKLIAPDLAGDADLVNGSRYVPGGSIPDWAWPQRQLSVWANRYASAVLGMSASDATARSRAHRAQPPSR